MNRDSWRTYQTEAEWLAARSAGYGIGSSAVAAILGHSSWRSPWDVWASFHAPEAAPDTAGPQLLRGHALEPLILRAYEAHADEVAEHYDRTIACHPLNDWARCSPDGVTASGGLVEIKTAQNGWAWRDAPPVQHSADGLEELPRISYGLQCYWQMLITGAPWVDLVVLPLSFDVAAICDQLLAADLQEALPLVVKVLQGSLCVTRIMRDEPFIKALAGQIATWRLRHLVEGTEPPAGHSKHASAHHGRAVKAGCCIIQDSDDPFTQAAEGLAFWKDRERHARQRVKQFTGAMKQAMQHVQEVQTPQGSVKWKRHGRGMRLDLDSFIRVQHIAEAAADATAGPDLPELQTLQPHQEE